MTTLPVYDMSGAKVGDYEIDPEVLAPKVSKQLLHDVVVMYLANQRQGSNKTKTRGEVSGSTKKMYKQKGTGNARAGSKRSGVRRGGGHINARQPRSYYYRLPRKAIQAATRMAIASKISAGSVVVVDQIKMDSPKTKLLASALKALGLEGQTKTLAISGLDRNIYLSGRNIVGLTISPVADLNALTVLRPRKLVMTREALDWIKARASA
ncbi:MAG TPA: 50S ribosomal protein L4 [Pirellula sp.]|nr:50S ribosomal protein L4 [Pirellula sp.]